MSDLPGALPARRVHVGLIPPLVAWVTMAGCTPRATPRALPPAAPAIASPAETLAAVRRRDERIRTLRARFSAVLRQASGERHVEGVLFLKKPDRFRLRLLSPFGLTVFDYASQGAHAQLLLPLEGTRWMDGEIAQHTALAPRDVQEALLQGAAASADRCLPQAAADGVLVSCHAPAGMLRRELHLQYDPAAVTREVNYVDGQPQLIIEYADYRETDGLPLPYTILLTYPARGSVMHIHVRSYEINPPLADDLFQ